MVIQKLSTHTFDMNEYFSGLRFSVGGINFEEDEKEEEAEKSLRDYENTTQGRRALRDIKEILRSLRKVKGQ